MAAKVLDSWPLLAFFKGEPAAQKVEEIIHRAALGRHELLMSMINWGEVYYSVMRADGQDVAEQKTREIASLPIEIVGIHDLEMTRQAAIYKATYPISYADAFAAALARQRKAEFITGDPDFKRLEKEIKIIWLK